MLQGVQWPNSKLTYKVKKYPSPSHIYKRTISDIDVNDTIRAAMGVWEAVTNLRFDKIDDGEVDIDISFDKEDHGDEDPFDGPSDMNGDNELGHAFFPGASLRADIHLDDTEHWTIKSYQGINLLYILTHKLGHSLVLRHSAEPRSIIAFL